MKPLLLVDYDGTICFDRFWRSIDPLVFTQIQTHLFGADRSLVRSWMRGQMSSEEINQFLAERMGIEFNELWRIFVDDCKTMKVSKDTLRRVSKIRSKFKAILLTDNMDCFSRFTVPALKLDGYFDEILNSADHGVMKDDAEGLLFQSLITQRSAEFRNCWLIDNSKMACDYFTRRGGNSGFVDPDHSVDFWLDQLLI